MGLGALLMAITGLFGTVNFMVSRRSLEFGVRMAMGATPVHVATLIVGGGMLPLGIGVVVGTGFASIIVPYMGETTAGASLWTPSILLGVVGSLFLAGLVALLPSVRNGIGVDVAKVLGDG